VNNYTPGSLGSFNGDSSFALRQGEQQDSLHRTRDALLTGNGSNARFISNLNKIPLGALWGPDPITGTPCPPNAGAGLTCDPTKWSDTQIQHFRMYQNYGKALIEVTHGSYANYNALMMTWHKTAGPVTFNTNYTFSKVLGLRDGQTNKNPIDMLELRCQQRQFGDSFARRTGSATIRDTTAECLSISLRKAGKRRHAICEPGAWPREVHSVPAPSCIT
jgi:hypothetical protein